jgi:hypothetical protein
MTTVTLASVKKKQTELATMIAKLAAAKPLDLPATAVVLADGERYAGLLLDSEGQPSHHLVLLPGEKENFNWKDALDWAASIGGDLPSRNEQAILFGNLKSQFQPKWYWSNQAHETDGSYAWFQGFYDGDQIFTHKSYEGRARAVRRFPV